MDPLIMDMFCENTSNVLCANVLLLLQERNGDYVDFYHELICTANLKINTLTAVEHFEDTINNLSNMEFYQHFRMTRTTMQKLTEYVDSKYVHNNNAVSLSKKIAVTVWTLANRDSYREVGNLFGLNKSSVCYIFHEICKLLSEYKNEWIQWPGLDEQRIIKDHTTFPNTVGFIDGCHIEIRAPNRNPTDFYNRKETHSIILQAVCDHSLKFLDIYIGQTGRVFRSSPLSRRLEDLVDPNDHILGDSAYTLSLRLLTPYRDNGHLTEAQKNYNTVHARSRSNIERSFGRLKGKFRRLKYLDLFNIREGPTIICAACVLHNFISKYEPFVDIDKDVNNIDVNLLMGRNTPAEKRNAICALLNNN